MFYDWSETLVSPGTINGKGKSRLRHACMVASVKTLLHNFFSGMNKKHETMFIYWNSINVVAWPPSTRIDQREGWGGQSYITNPP